MPAPRIAIFVVYFGPLPGYFSLWLNACAQNPGFDWRVYTDADASCFAPPPNVSIRPLTLAEFGDRLGQRLGLTLNLISPYKVCDFRPLFWTFLGDEPRPYDFWGHCDLDMIFGDLGAFITPDILARYDKIFTLGHLTLYRNTPYANEMYRQPHPRWRWRDVLSDPRPRGFDEHLGVGQIWRGRRARLYKNEAIVADIDPALARFERSPPYRNDADQLFFYERGRVWRVFWRGGAKRREEFAYIHFQKRRAMHALPRADAQSFLIAPGGFFACDYDDLTPQTARRFNPARFSWRDLWHRWRAAWRHWRRRGGFTRDLRGVYR